MRLLAPFFPGQFRRGSLVSLAFFAMAAATAYQTAIFIVSGDLVGLAYVGIVFAIAAFVVAILHDWRNGLYLFVAWLLFEDLGRKFLGNNMGIYFAKDGLLLIIYLAFFVAYRRRDNGMQTFRPPFLMILLAFVWFGVMQVFNPASTHIVYGLLGMKLYFYYTPLIVLGYALITSERDLRKFFQVNLALMVVIIALGIVQSIAGPKFLNPDVLADDIRLLSQTYRTAPISGVMVYRPTSIFVSIGRFQDLVILAWLLVFGFTGYLLLRHRRGRKFTFLALVVIVAACVMAASRGVFMWTIGLAVVVLLFTYPDAFLNRLAVFSETLDPRSPSSELVHRAHDYPLRNFLAAFDYERWPYGYGIGTTSLGGQYVARFFHVHPPVGSVESGFGTLIVEMGIGGLALWLALSAGVLISAWRVVRQLKGSPWFPLGFMIFWYAFLL